MKICILTENYYRGGLDTFIISLINNWPNNKDKFIIICNESHPGLYDIERRVKKSIKVIRYNFFFTTKTTNGFSNNKLFKSFFFRAFFRICNKFLEYPFLSIFYFFYFKNYFFNNKFDRFLSINGGYPASLICRVGLISWNSLYGNSNSYLLFHSHAMKIKFIFYFIDNFIDKLVYKSVSKIITVSLSCVESIKNRNSIFRNEKILHIYNGVDDLYNKKLIFPTSKTFIMLSTYTSIKGYDLLIKIVKKLKPYNSDFRIKIFGYGKDHELKKINNYITENNLEKFIKIYSFTNKPTFQINKALALLCLSQSQEAFGLTLIEAMSLGKPILTTNVGGLKEVFKYSKAGFMYDKNDVEGFVKGMLLMLENKDLVNKFSLNARQHYYKYFSSKTMAQKYYEIIK